MGKPKQAPKRTVRTSNAALQAKLDLLARFVGEDNIDEFVKNFVPLDLSAEDLEFYTTQLKTNADMWSSLKWEISTLASGTGVRSITGDQDEEAIFTFDLRTPDGNADIDREVVFLCKNGDWRAEG